MSTRAHRLLSGSTEVGYLAVEDVEPENWQYRNFSPSLNIDLRFFGDGMYELVAVRDKGSEAFQRIFSTFPDLQKYSMKDLFVKHPTKEGLWRSCGRTDDVIVFTDAQKLNPTLIESVIQSHPLVTSAVLYGNARPQPALLFEPAAHSTTEEERETTRCRIWEAAKRARERPLLERLMKIFSYSPFQRNPWCAWM